MPNWNGEQITLSIVKVYKGKIIKVDPIPRRSFILMASGDMKSPANLSQENLFKKHQINSCDVVYHKEQEIHNITCFVIDNLWKLRYQKQKIFDDKATTTLGGKSIGWAKNPYSPDKHQLSLLQEFGIKQVSDVAWGDNCFKLIGATQNNNWVNLYNK